MTLMQSALGFIASLIIAVGCSFYDKKHEGDKFRVLIAVAGIMAMMCLFFLLVNILLSSGVLK